MYMYILKVARYVIMIWITLVYTLFFLLLHEQHFSALSFQAEVNCQRDNKRYCLVHWYFFNKCIAVRYTIIWSIIFIMSSLYLLLYIAREAFVTTCAVSRGIQHRCSPCQSVYGWSWCALYVCKLLVHIFVPVSSHEWQRGQSSNQWEDTY